MEEGKSEPKKLFYVPLSIKMLLDCKGDECRIDDFDIKSVCFCFALVLSEEDT